MALQPVTTADEYLAAILAELQALNAQVAALGATCGAGLAAPPPAPEEAVALREPEKPPRTRDEARARKRGSRWPLPTT